MNTSLLVLTIFLIVALTIQTARANVLRKRNAFKNVRINALRMALNQYKKIK